MNFKTKSNHILYYFLALTSSLSSAAASMTLIALSASLYSVDSDGMASSMIYALYYFGIGVVGLGGGWVLQRFTAINIGLTGALLCSGLLFYLSTFEVVNPAVGLSCVFIIFLLNGIDHPNSLRFFNEALDEDIKLSFFSAKETLTYIFNLAAPPFAALIITFWSAQACFYIDGLTYLLSGFSWILLRKQVKPVLADTNPDIFAGFKLLVRNKNILNLTLSRLLNNLSYVTWTASLPILIAKIARGNVEWFVREQAFATSFVSIGFILASIVVLYLSKQRKIIVPMTWGASLFGLAGIILSVASLHQNLLLYASAVFNGMGTYCFRLSGITLGQAFTPKELLGATIIAGDTIVRSWSFLISILTIALFEFHETYEFSTWILYPLILSAPLLSLISPFILGNMATAYSLRNSSE